MTLQTVAKWSAVYMLLVVSAGMLSAMTQGGHESKEAVMTASLN